MPSRAERIVLGAVAGGHGVHGDVRLKSFCAEPSDIANYGPVEDEHGNSYTVTLLRPIKGGYVARLSGVTGKEAADRLRGHTLSVSRVCFPDLAEDEFYHVDLIGLEAVDTGGAPLGRIHAVHDHGAGDILEVRQTGANVLVPFTRAVVPTVDIKKGRVVIDPPEGLFPE